MKKHRKNDTLMCYFGSYLETKKNKNRMRGIPSLDQATCSSDRQVPLDFHPDF